MSNLTQLRLDAHEIFAAAVRAIDAGAAIRNAVRIEASNLVVCGSSIERTPKQSIYSIAIGKAAVAMAKALDEVLADRLIAGVIAGPALNTATSSFAQHAGSRWRYFAGGHPLPDETSLAAARAAFALLERANEQRALVIFLISGGGSAMMEWPINDDTTLDDLRAANQALVNSGASISEINSVRRTFSAIKGGGLSARAHDCAQVSLIVSDVPNGEEHNAASGPTMPPPKEAPDVIEVVSRYRLREKLPASILSAIGARPRSNEQPSWHQTFVLLNNNSALEAAASRARQLGYSTSIVHDISDEPIEVGCEKLLSQLVSARDSAEQTCLISGGEFACPVRGNGIGGRNLETALRLAYSTKSSLSNGNFVALCAGTDGIDGNSPAVGAIVDSTTVERARKIGLDSEDFLKRSDSYSFFVALGDVITTGPTGTNVRDLRILLASND